MAHVRATIVRRLRDLRGQPWGFSDAFQNFIREVEEVVRVARHPLKLSGGVTPSVLASIWSSRRLLVLATSSTYSNSSAAMFATRSFLVRSDTAASIGPFDPVKWPGPTPRDEKETVGDHRPAGFGSEGPLQVPHRPGRLAPDSLNLHRGTRRRPQPRTLQLLHRRASRRFPKYKTPFSAAVTSIALGGGRDDEPEHPVDLVALVSGEPVEVLRDLRGHRLQQGVAVAFEVLGPLLGEVLPPISCSFVNPAACWSW
jgi:hypothetical protein